MHVLLQTVAAVLAVCGARAGSLSGRVSVLPGLENHKALTRLDLQFCGSGSESQISRGPLGCGFPVVGDHPWLVALGFTSVTRGSLRLRYLCSGALISDRHVVTSARCARGTSSLRLRMARLGEYDFSSRRDCLWYDPSTCTEAEEVPVAGVSVHPQFVKQGGKASRFDVAVVRLARPVTMRYGLRPICLPLFQKRRPSHRQFALTLGLHSGSGSKAADGAATCCSCDRDRSATDHVMDAQRLNVFNTSFQGEGACHYRMLPDHPGEPARCMGSGEPCLADLGAPLVAADRFGTTFYLEGVASLRPLQSSCKATDAQVEYAPVRPHLRWILNAIEALERRAQAIGVHALVNRFLTARRRAFLWRSRRKGAFASTNILFPGQRRRYRARAKAVARG